MSVMREPVPRDSITPLVTRMPFSLRVLPPPPFRAGRPTDLTTEKARVILVALANGSYRGPAAEYGGIPEETLSRWMKRTGEPYDTFQRWVREAEAAAEMRMVNAITTAATSKPEYAVTFLERKFPERWGRAVATQPVNVNVNVSSLLQQIEARAGQASDPRPPRPDRATIFDVLSAPVRQPVPLNANNGDEDAVSSTDETAE